MIQKGGQCGRHHGLMQSKDSQNRNGSAVPDRRHSYARSYFGIDVSKKHLTYA